MHWRRVACGAAALSLVATGFAVRAASAGPNRCHTAPPTRSPTATNGFGSQWFDQHGVAEQAPESAGFFGYGGVDFDNRSVEADPLNDDYYQLNLGPSTQCVNVMGISNGPDEPAYPILPPPAIVPLPWLHREGNVFQAADGRTTVLRGFDNTSHDFGPPSELGDQDMVNMASWGFNLLRIRIDGFRAGYDYGSKPEPGYWEHLDQVIADANRHGIYVLLSTVTNGDVGAEPEPQAEQEARWVPGTPQNTWWVNFETTMFERYKNWPGVVGYDPINEDDTLPPPVMDNDVIGAMHKQADDALRNRVGDTRHVYFQEPSGWAYWGAQYWNPVPGANAKPEAMVGVDIGDPNRFFCPKQESQDVSGPSWVAEDERMAHESNAPMFVCEHWVNGSTQQGADAGHSVAIQRSDLQAMDKLLLGSAMWMYGPDQGGTWSGTSADLSQDAPWLGEYARPYPAWVGGKLTSVTYDFAERRLSVAVDLDGSGPTEIYAGSPGTYPRGFVATSTTGASLVYDGADVVSASGMTWDASQHRIDLPAQPGAVTITLTAQK